MKKYIRIILVFIFFLFFQQSLYAHTEHPKEQKGISIDEKLGQVISLDLTFQDENDDPISLKQLIHTPTILAPVYFSCPDICNFLFIKERFYSSR